MQHDSAAISQFLILNSQLNKIRKRVNPSLYVRRENVQPWRLSTSLINTRPIPCPFGLVEKKGLKSLASVSLLIPGPLSTISMKAVQFHLFYQRISYASFIMQCKHNVFLA